MKKMIHLLSAGILGIIFSLVGMQLFAEGVMSGESDSLSGAIIEYLPMEELISSVVDSGTETHQVYSDVVNISSANSGFENTGSENTGSDNNGFIDTLFIISGSTDLSVTSSGEIGTGSNIDDFDPAMAVLYIPDQTSNGSNINTSPQGGIVAGGDGIVAGGDGIVAGGDGIVAGGEDNSGTIYINVADIDYQTPIQNISPGNCTDRFCITVSDGHGSLGWYIGIQQTDMVSTGGILYNKSLFMNTDNSPLVTVSKSGSPDARSIPTNGSVDFADNAEHIIISKQRMDGITGVYGLNPAFFADIYRTPAGSYEGSSIITLYYY